MTPTERAARAVLDALNDRQPERVRELVTAEFVDHGAPPGLVPPGPDGYIAVLRFLVDVLQLRYEVHDVSPTATRWPSEPPPTASTTPTTWASRPRAGRMPCPPCTCTGARATAWPSTGACATS